MLNLDTNVIKIAAKVSDFMRSLYLIDEKRFTVATGECIPYGDLAYGEALCDWYSKNKPSNAWFSYAETEQPCPLLMEFRKEIGDHFGLRILTWGEAEVEKLRYNNIKTKRVCDWGFN